MADLGNLWFSLGLDDKKFEKQWNAAFAKYKQQAKIDVGVQIAPTDLTQLNNIQNKLNAFANRFNGNTKAKIDLEVTPNTLQALQALKSLGGTKGDWAVVKEAAKALREVSKAATQAAMDQQKLNNQVAKGQKKVNANYNQQSLWLQNLSNLASNYFSLYTVKNFATELVTVTGEFEKQRVTLQAMVGEMEGLDIYNKMKELSVQSPFQFKDLASYAKQLAAFSVPYNELYDTTKRLADVSAGLGVDMSRIILAYGQIRSAGVLKGTELRQLTEAGVPILEKLADKIYEATGKTVALGDVFDKISQKAISFEMMKEVFEDMTSAGGKFYNMQEVQAETLSGKISNLKDAYDIMLTEIGDRTDGALRSSVEVLYNLINNWERLGNVVLSVALAYGTYQLAQAAAFTWDKIKLVGSFVEVLFRLRLNVVKAARAMATLNIASKAGVWGAVAAAIVGVTTALIAASGAANRFKRELQGVIDVELSNFTKEADGLNALTEAIEKTVEGTESRKLAIDEYNRRFGQYLNNLYDENTALETIKNGYDGVRKAMSDRYKEEALIKAEQEVNDNFKKNLINIQNTYKEALSEIDFGTLSGSAIAIIEDVLKANKDATIQDVKKAFDDAFKENESLVLNFRLQPYFESYKRYFLEYYNALQTAMREVDNSFNLSVYNSWKTQEAAKRAAEEYQKELDGIRGKEKAGSKELKDGERDAEIKYLTKLTQIYAGMPSKLKEYENRLKALTQTETTWRDSIAKDVEKLGLTVGFAPKTDESYPKYVERIREEWELINKAIEKYNGKDVDGGLAAYTKEKDALLKLAELRGIILDPKKDTKDAKEKERKRINALKDEYNWLLKVYEAYKKYIEEGVSVKDAKNMVLGDFTDIPINFKPAFEGETDIYTWFRTEMGRLAAEAEKNGSDTGIAFKSGLVRKMGTINAEEVLKSLKLGEKIQDELTKWGLEDFALQGEGVTLDLSKIAAEYARTDNEIYAKRKELLAQIAAAERGNEAQIAALKKKYGKDWATKAKNELDRLAAVERDNNKKIAEDKIYDLAKAYSKVTFEDLLPADFMSSLGDKSIKQLKEAKEKIAEAAGDIPEFIFDNKVTDLFAEFNIDWDKFIEKYQEYIKLQGKDVDDEILKKKQKALEFALDTVRQLVDAMKSLAKENSAFEGALEGLEMSLDVADAAMKGYQAGGVWGAIAAGVVAAAAAIIKQISAAKQYREEMERAAKSFEMSIVSSRRELKIAGEEFNTIFGEDLISAFEADSEAINEIVRQLKSSATEVSKMKITTRKGFFGIGHKSVSLKDLAPQLFKADGSVNGEYLDEFLETYGDKLDEGQKLILENLKDSYSQYENAMADIGGYLSNIFSDTASTIAERMMDSFAQTGDAATELGDLVSGVAKQMGQDLIESILLEQYLQPYMDRIKDLYNPNSNLYEADPTLRVQKAILAYQDGLSAIESGASEFNKIFQGIKDLGVDFSTGAENASQVLSGLTEDQQNLLVSYINAIRADVSMNKGMLTSIVNSVGTINNNIATAIVIWTQIEANTHRSADGVDRIIGFFESVMGPYDGGTGQAFQVNIA